MIFRLMFRRRLVTLHYVASANALANSMMFFSKKSLSLSNILIISLMFVILVHAAAFGYGITLVQSGEMQFQDVFRVFSVITFAAISIGRSASVVPNYSKGKESAKRILDLNKRQSKIDPDDPSGITLVNLLLRLFFH
jgi:hypothetical protein